MKLRRGILSIVSLVLLINLLIQPSDAYVGLNPAAYSVDFQPNLKQVFNFNFYSDDSETRFNISVSGDLAQYVELNRDELSGSGNVNVLLKLPRSIDKPGVHRIYITATQLPKSNQGTLGIVASLRGIIAVRIPYPGKYAELEFSAEDANAGEPVDLKLKIYSRGEENIVTTSYIELFDFKNKSLGTLPLGIYEVLSAQSVEIDKQLATKDYPPGKYRARAIVQYYDKKTDAEEIFRLGELYVDIVNYTTEFERKKINPINIDVESFWNDPIENVYGEITILGHENTIPPFPTPSVSLQGFERKTVTGFFDTSSIEESKFKARVVLHYYDKTSEKILDLRFKRELNYYQIGIILGLAILTATIIVLIIWIRKLKRSVKKK